MTINIFTNKNIMNIKIKNTTQTHLARLKSFLAWTLKVQNRSCDSCDGTNVVI
jgi:hypothetical protein